MYPFPFGKLGMHLWAPQNSTSVAWLEEPGFSTCSELVVLELAELAELVAGDEDCPDEHWEGTMLARTISHRAPFLLSW